MATSASNGVVPPNRLASLFGRTEPTDGQLLTTFIEHRDGNAFATLVGRHGPMVWGVCRRLLPAHDAEDAFQATFLVLVRKATTVAPRDMVGNWLYGVARQTALQARRTAARRMAREANVGRTPEASVADDDLGRELEPILDEELSRLPDHYRGVLVLCDLEGLTRKETAVRLGVPEGSVASRLARARAMLAKRLNKRGVAVTTLALTALLSQQTRANAPPWLAMETIDAAAAYAAGRTIVGLTSGKVVPLADGVLKAMFMKKLKLATLVLAASAILGGVGAGGLLAQAPSDQDPAPKPTPSASVPARKAPSSDAKPKGIQPLTGSGKAGADTQPNPKGVEASKKASAADPLAKPEVAEATPSVGGAADALPQPKQDGAPAANDFAFPVRKQFPAENGPTTGADAADSFGGQPKLDRLENPSAGDVASPITKPATAEKVSPEKLDTTDPFGRRFTVGEMANPMATDRSPSMAADPSASETRAGGLSVLTPEQIFREGFVGPATLKLAVQAVSMGGGAFSMEEATNRQVAQAADGKRYVSRLRIMLAPAVEARLRQLGVEDLQAHFYGKTVRVAGSVKQEVVAGDNGARLVTYMLTVERLDQLQSVGKGASEGGPSGPGGFNGPIGARN